MIRDIRNHDNAKKEWTDEELKKLYETHERLLDLVSLFCFVPRAKYLPLGPIRYIRYRLILVLFVEIYGCWIISKSPMEECLSLESLKVPKIALFICCSHWSIFQSLLVYYLLYLYFNISLLCWICHDSAKLIDIYRTKHNISASTGLNDPAVATGISELIYESTKSAPAEPDELDDDLVNAWAANLGDDGLWDKNAPAMNRVRVFTDNVSCG